LCGDGWAKALPRQSAAAAAAAAGPCQRRFASTVFNVKPRPGEPGPDQTLFVVGLNKGKFFGQDSAEEALKLLERIAEQKGPTYQLLLGIHERELREIEDSHKVKNDRLTPSRELEGERNCEMIPIVQASMVDKCPRRALGRILRETQSHVSWLLWKHPREAVQLYWAFWKRKEYKDAEARKFWKQHFPISSHAFFDEISELVAIRSVELLAASHVQGKEGTFVLVVNNMFYEPLTERLRLMLDEDVNSKLESTDFLRNIRDRATELCLQIPDLTPVLVFMYIGVPFLIAQFFYLGAEYYVKKAGVVDEVFPVEHRD